MTARALATLIGSCGSTRHRSAPGCPIAPARLIARWVLVSLALLAVLTALVGLAFAGSSVRIADGVADRRRRRRRADEERGADAARAALRRASRTFRSCSRRAARSIRSRRRRSASRPTGSTAIESAAREGEGFGPVRGFKRLQTRFFGSEIAPPVRVYKAALDFKLAGLATRHRPEPRRGEARAARPRASRSCPGQPGRRLAQRASRHERIVRSLARLERGQPVALPVLLDPVEVTAAELAPAAAQARVALSAPVRLEYEGTRWKLPRWRIAELLSLPGRRRDRGRDRRPRRRGLVQAAAQDRRAGARRRRLRGRAGRHPTSSPTSRPGRRRARDGEGAPRCGDVGNRSDGSALRAHGARRALDRRRPGDGDHRRRRQLLHDLRRHPEPPAQRRTRGAADRRRAGRARQDVLIQRHDRRAHGREGVRGGAGDHQRRAPDRSRRRHLPGLDDRLQRGLRGGPADRRAHEPRALHLALPARPRRDGQLSRSRPQVHERHRPLAAAADVRRLRLADRQPLRDAAEPARRDDGAAAPASSALRRSSACPIRRSRRARPWSRSTASRPARRASAARSTTPTARCCTRTRGTPPTAPSRRSFASARSRSPSPSPR